MVLTLLLLVPFAGSLAVLLIPRAMKGIHQYVALGIALLTLLLSMVLLAVFPYGQQGFHCGVVLSWVPSLGIDYRVGIDGLSLVLVVLTALLSTLVIPASFSSIKKNEKEFYFFLLLLETGVLGTFVALDLFLFYFFWELMLIPMYFLIGIWGGEQRIYASIKFFIYTAVGSVIMLLVIFYLYFQASAQHGTAPSFYFANFINLTLAPATQKWLFWGFIVAFLIKTPVFPFHSWLPFAYPQAPTAATVILAGVMMKTGIYAILRFAVPIFPQAVVQYTPVLLLLAIIGVLYGAMLAMIQGDIKKLIAYSSFSHAGMLFAGLLAWNIQGLEGGIIQMINHGLSTGALFLLVGIIYERRNTYELSEFGGLAKVMPVYATIFMIIMLSSIGLPGLNGFIGEFLILSGLMGYSVIWASIAALGVILGAVYMLRLYRCMFFGEVDKAVNQNLHDINGREYYLLLPIVILCFVIGVYPYPIQKTIEPSVAKIIEYVQPHLETQHWYDKEAAKQPQVQEKSTAK